MSDWTPEDVDALFQEGSEEHEFEYNEAAWGQMENLLERRDRRRRLMWWLVGTTVSLFLLISAYTIWGDTSNHQEVSNKDKLELSNSDKFTPLKDEKKETTKEIIPKSEKQSTNLNKNTKTTTIAKTELSLKEEKTIFPKKTNTQIKTIEKNSVTVHELTKIEKKKSPTIINDTEKLQVPKIDVNQAAEQKAEMLTDDFKITELSTNTESVKTATKELEDGNNNHKGPSAVTQTALTTELAILPSLSMQIDYSTAPIDFNKSIMEDLDKAQRATTESDLRSPNYFVVGALLSKEFSFVDMSDMTNLKWKAGLSVAYRYGEKHALKLSANYSQKDYMVSTIENYQVEDGFWPKATAPNTASGICDVLELSLSESYFFNGYDKKGFFVNAGLTSYFLLREQYNYTYDTNDPELLWSWGEDNANRHWFGIGEVSIGYNLPFTDKSSLQIAPYAQIPLTGVGHGALKIFSSGVLIRYNFHLR